MMLTKDEIGAEQYAKGMTDRMRFRSSSVLARSYASERGKLAISHIAALLNAIDNPLYSELARLQFAQEAEMLARMAFKGWRAYRLMKGD